jgi:hypothetical protein
LQYHKPLDSIQRTRNQSTSSDYYLVAQQGCCFPTRHYARRQSGCPLVLAWWSTLETHRIGFSFQTDREHHFKICARVLASVGFEANELLQLYPIYWWLRQS